MPPKRLARHDARIQKLTEKLNATNDEEKKQRIQAKIDAATQQRDGGDAGGGAGRSREDAFVSNQAKRMAQLQTLQTKFEAIDDDAKKAKFLGKVSKRRANVAKRLEKLQKQQAFLAKQIEGFQAFHDGLLNLGDAEPRSDSEGSETDGLTEVEGNMGNTLD
eukprot:TRINITY_DN1820_c0_g1_i1.p2 TRINITY_DN1820_c0_g1~~TRINITY_DN1820_c0_g1_i1.p2  ORF type:complete len:162 (-),score=48.29 TRINITY_DN1820_c0_g1_i1:348-833(-)